jgi:hypothetical protein
LSAFTDVTERVPELIWPDSISTYSAMRTDAQVASLLLAFTLPTRRYHWSETVLQHSTDRLISHRFRRVDSSSWLIVE